MPISLKIFKKSNIVYTLNLNSENLDTRKRAENRDCSDRIGTGVNFALDSTTIGINLNY